MFLNSFIISIIFSIITATLCFGNTPVKHNNDYNTTRDIEIMKFTLDRIKKSYVELEKKYDECDDKRKSNVIADFDFSNPILDNQYLESWIMSYDLSNTFKCTNKVESKVIRYVLGFNEIKKYYKQEKIKIPDDILMSLNIQGVATLEYDRSLIPVKVKEYLDKRLNKLFYGRKLIEAYETYLEKQK